MQPTETEKQKQRLWAKLGFLFTMFLAALCLMGVIQSAVLISFSNTPQSGAWRNLIICAIGLPVSFIGFVFFALMFHKAKKNPMIYTQRKHKE